MNGPQWIACLAMGHTNNEQMVDMTCMEHRQYGTLCPTKFIEPLSDNYIFHQYTCVHAVFPVLIMLVLYQDGK